MQVMCSRVEGEVHTFVQEVEKFSARWEQLKPKADFLDGDRATYTSALASLKDRRNEFDELLKTADKLKLVNTAVIPISTYQDCITWSNAFVYLILRSPAEHIHETFHDLQRFLVMFLLIQT